MTFPSAVIASAGAPADALGNALGNAVGDVLALAAATAASSVACSALVRGESDARELRALPGASQLSAARAARAGSRGMP
jgi:hypothetical protein